MRGVLFALIIATLSAPAGAATWYVRTDGSDSCNGTANAPDSAGNRPNCAFRTIDFALGKASCGDTINVGAGDYYGEDLKAFPNCTGAPLTLRGAGRSPATGTRVYLELLDIDESACTQVATNVWECPAPSGAMTSPTATSEKQAAYQWIDPASNQYVAWSCQRTDGEMQGWVQLAWMSSVAAVNTNPGSLAYNASNNTFRFRLWNDATPASTSLAVPKPYDNGVGVDLRSKSGITLEGLLIVAGTAECISPKMGDNYTFRDLTCYGGGIIAQGVSSDWVTNLTIERVSTLNQIGRPIDETESSCLDGCWEYGSFSSDTQCLQLSGVVSSTITDFTCGHARNGVSFANGTKDITVTRMREYGAFNHGVQFLTGDGANSADDPSVVRNILVQDSEFGASQEGIFLVCVRDVEFRHITISEPSGFQIKGYLTSGKGCPFGLPRNIDVFNSVLNGRNVWYQEIIDARCNAGGNEDFDWDYNVYPSDLPSGTVHRHSASNSTMNLAAWQSWSGDCAGGSTRDPNSRQSAPRASIFKNPGGLDDANDVTNPPLADLVDSASNPAVNFSSSAWAGSGVDLDGNPRVGPPDAGAYESTVGGSPQCSDGIDNDGDGKTDHPADSGCQDANDNSEAMCGDGFIDAGEQCDGANLGGMTCSGLGHDQGTLACTASCTFDESGCKDAPPPVNNLHRTDTK